MAKSYKVKDKDSKQKIKLAPNFQVRMHDQIEKSEKIHYSSFNVGKLIRVWKFSDMHAAYWSYSLVVTLY